MGRWYRGCGARAAGHRSLALVCLVAAALVGGCRGAGPPNLVVIFVDDLGYADLGCYGAEGIATPRLDVLAAEGMRLTSFYVAAPVCTPSRAALLTGCYPDRVGLGHRVVFPYSEKGLHQDEITLAELLREQGYRTACIGKWHLGHHPGMRPRDQGFDRFYGIPYSHDMGNHPYPQGRSPPLPLYDDDTVVEEDPDPAGLTGQLTEAALEFIQDNREQPFFLYLAHPMPHRPLAASAAFRGRSARGLYGDVVEELDACIGRLLDELQRLDLADNTLVLFTSDNGPVDRRSAGPLRGRKNTTWEGGMRVPCLARWPGHIPAGSTSDELVTALDLLPTFAAVLEAPVPDDRQLDGRDAWPVLAGQPNARSSTEAFYYYRDERLQAVRAGRYKLHVFRPEWETADHSPLLFDLQRDPGESRDLAAQQPDVVERLQGLADRARHDLGDASRGIRGVGVRPAGSR